MNFEFVLLDVCPQRLFHSTNVKEVKEFEVSLVVRRSVSSTKCFQKL